MFHGQPFLLTTVVASFFEPENVYPRHSRDHASLPWMDHFHNRPHSLKACFSTYPSKYPKASICLRNRAAVRNCSIPATLSTVLAMSDQTNQLLNKIHPSEYVGNVPLCDSDVGFADELAKYYVAIKEIIWNEE